MIISTTLIIYLLISLLSGYLSAYFIISAVMNTGFKYWENETRSLFVAAGTVIGLILFIINLALI